MAHDALGFVKSQTTPPLVAKRPKAESQVTDRTKFFRLVFVFAIPLGLINSVAALDFASDCNPSKWKPYLGRRISDQLKEELKNVSHKDMVVIIKLGEALSGNALQNRLVVITDNEIIRSIVCE
jgi:hypothetical protein